MPRRPGRAAGARVLTDRLAAALRAQIVEADDRHTLRLLELVEELWREADGAPPAGDAARVGWMQRAMQTYRSLLERAPEETAAFRRELEAFDAESQKAGLAAERLSRSYSSGVVARFVARRGPVAAARRSARSLRHRPARPSRTSSRPLAVRLIPHTDEEEATDKIAAGLVLYPLAWAGRGVGRLCARRDGSRSSCSSWRCCPRASSRSPGTSASTTWPGDARVRADSCATAIFPYRLRRRRQALATELARLVRLAPEPFERG